MCLAIYTHRIALLTALRRCDPGTGRVSRTTLTAVLHFLREALAKLDKKVSSAAAGEEVINESQVEQLVSSLNWDRDDQIDYALFLRSFQAVDTANLVARVASSASSPDRFSMKLP